MNKDYSPELEHIDHTEACGHTEINEEVKIVLIWLTVTLTEQVLCLYYLPDNLAGQRWLRTGTAIMLITTLPTLFYCVVLRLDWHGQRVKRHLLISLIIATIWNGGMIGAALIADYLGKQASYGEFRSMANFAIGCAILFLAVVAVVQLKGFLPNTKHK